jgi:hypothetical protein
VEYEDQAERMEKEADKLEEHSEAVGRRIEEARKDWESKQEDQQVPGAQPAHDDEGEE